MADRGISRQRATYCRGLVTAAHCEGGFGGFGSLSLLVVCCNAFGLQLRKEDQAQSK